MKRFIAVLLLFVFCIGFSGCNNAQVDNTHETLSDIDDIEKIDINKQDDDKEKSEELKKLATTVLIELGETEDITKFVLYKPNVETFAKESAQIRVLLECSKTLELWFAENKDGSFKIISIQNFFGDDIYYYYPGAENANKFAILNGLTPITLYDYNTDKKLDEHETD